MLKGRRALKKIIGEYVLALRARGINVDRIILFGSFARGRPHPYSDIDLSVISGDFAKMNILERQEILGLANMRIKAPIEAIGYSPHEMRFSTPGSFLHEIKKTGRMVYRH